METKKTNGLLVGGSYNADATNKKMKILSIDTSCDETSVAITQGVNILSNIIWSQASSHAKFGGVMPSLAQRMHEERIDWVIDKAIHTSGYKIKDVDAFAVTVGPGLSIALGVGIDRAKKLALKYNKPLIPVNHIEAHLLSAFSNSDQTESKLFPAYGLVVSGGNTIFIHINKIGDYITLAETHDDALGEALDKGARLLGLGYPGGAILEKFAKNGNPKKYSLPIPLIDDRIRNRFSYSGLKTSFVRLVNTINNPSKQEIFDLAASYQNVAFEHITRVLEYQITNNQTQSIKNLFLGGGVAANVELRKRLRKLCKKYKITLLTPYSKKLYGDNAAMVGVCAFLNPKSMQINKIDRNPNMKI